MGNFFILFSLIINVDCWFTDHIEYFAIFNYKIEQYIVYTQCLFISCVIFILTPADELTASAAHCFFCHSEWQQFSNNKTRLKFFICWFFLLFQFIFCGCILFFFWREREDLTLKQQFGPIFGATHLSFLFYLSVRATEWMGSFHFYPFFNFDVVISMLNRSFIYSPTK